MKHSKFLIQGEAPVVSFPCLVNVVGRAESAILQKIHYLVYHSTLCNVGTYKIERTVRNKKKFIGVAYEAIVELMGMMSLSTVKRAVKRLRDLGILVVEKLAKSVWVRLNFYRIDYHKLNDILGLDVLDDSDDSPKDENLNKEISHKVRVAQEERAVNKPKTEPLPQGADKPTLAGISNELLDAQPEDVRKLYMMLRGYCVDIDLSHALFKRAKTLNRRIVAQHITSRKSGLDSLYWHTPEQLGLNVFLGV